MKSLFISFLVSFSFMAQGFSQSAPLESTSHRTQVLDFKLLAGSKNTGFGFNYKSLYNLGPSMKIGWSAGYTSHSAELEHNFIPVTFQAVGDLATTGRTLFYNVGLGYGIGLPEPETFATKTYGGVTYEVSIGLRNKSLETSPFIALGYHTQRAKYEGTDQFGDGNRTAVYKRWSISVGAFF